MTKLEWNQNGSSFREVGVSKGVVYPAHHPVAVWSGLTSVTEKPVVETNSYFLNGEKRLDKMSTEDFSASVEAFIYPEIIDNERAIFLGFTYRTDITNGRYKLHLVYNPKFVIGDKQYTTINEETESSLFVWDLVTKPVEAYGYAPTAHLILESNQDFSSTMKIIEGILYGTDQSAPYWPTFETVLDIVNNSGQFDTLLIIDHGNGIWTAVGPDDMVYYTDDTTFVINSPSLEYINEETYRVSSL